MRRTAVAPAVFGGRDAVDTAHNPRARKPFQQPVLARYGQLGRITMASNGTGDLHNNGFGDAGVGTPGGGGA
jgi:hypothetical protein